MRPNHMLGRARHFGNRAYDLARHTGSVLNNIVETGARVYGGIVQPMLAQRGIDTRGTDEALVGMYKDWGTAQWHEASQQYMAAG